MTTYKEMWEIIEKYSFEFDVQQMDLFSCIICHKVLIDAWEGRCGCTYCKKCIDAFINEGGQSCPCGNGEFTIDGTYFESDIKKSYHADKNVSEMTVKCPSNACNHKCTLIKMSNHLRYCSKRLIECPFVEIGCVGVMMERKDVSNHLLVELYQHSILMIEGMKNMKNEITDLMMSVSSEIARNEIDKSMEMISEINNQRNRNADGKDFHDFGQEIISLRDKIEGLNRLIKDSQELFDEEIRLYKGENENLNKRICDLLEENKNLFNENKQQNYKLKEMENTNLQLSQNHDKIINNKNIEIDRLTEQIKELHAKRIFGRRKNPLLIKASSVDQSDLSLRKSIASFQWLANDISRLHKFSNGNDKFYSDDNRYEIRFKLFPFGCCDDHKNTHICIRFRMLDGNVGNKSNQWPLKCVMTVSMKSQMNENNISLERNLIFQEPTIDQVLLLLPQFHFIQSELTAKNIISNNSVLIEFDMRTD